MTPVNPIFQQQLLGCLPKRFAAHIATDVTHKIEHLNVCNKTGMAQAKANRQAVSNYFYRIFGVGLNSVRGKAIIRKANG